MNENNLELDLLAETSEICAASGINPARSRGQNFLINKKVYEDILVTADLTNDNVVLEVGPGLGFLTSALARKVKKVIAVELDDKLASILRFNLAKSGIKNVSVVNENILNFDITRSIYSELKAGYDIVANLPYNISSIFLRKFLSIQDKPRSMVLMLQKEVAERICASSPEMSILAVSVQYFAKPEIIGYVPREDFWPAPVVDSAIVKIIIDNGGVQRTGEEEKAFFRLVKIGFAQKRKMLRNNLANGFHVSHDEAGEWIEKAGLNSKVRAQELRLEDWRKLLLSQ